MLIMWVFLRKYCVPILFIFILNIDVSAQIGESRLKSIWLEKFSKFIEWPSSDSIQYFTITILGDGDINADLESIYKNRTIKNKPVQIRKIDQIDSLGDSNILFVNENCAKDIDKILSIVEGKPILTVGDTQGFARRGIIINFYLEQNKIRFELNISAAKSSGLDVDFRLLEAAKIVKKI